MKLREPIVEPKKYNFTDEYKKLMKSLKAQDEKQKAKQDEVDYKKLYEKLKQEHENLKQQLEETNQPATGNNNIQISAGQNVNITISEGDRFSDSVNMEERK
jgi:organic radical activating enzyme